MFRHKKFQGQRAFSYIGPVTWNSLTLPFAIHHAQTLPSFKSKLTTDLFCQSNPIACHWSVHLLPCDLRGWLGIKNQLSIYLFMYVWVRVCLPWGDPVWLTDYKPSLNNWPRSLWCKLNKHVSSTKGTTFKLTSYLDHLQQPDFTHIP